MLQVAIFFLLLISLALGLHKFSTTKPGKRIFTWLSWYIHHILIVTGAVFLLLPIFGYHYQAFQQA